MNVPSKMQYCGPRLQAARSSIAEAARTVRRTTRRSCSPAPVGQAIAARNASGLCGGAAWGDEPLEVPTVAPIGNGRVGRRTPAPVPHRVHVGELGAQVQDERRIVDPEQEN